MKTFKTYALAVNFYRYAATLELRGHLKEQLLRASSSIALNLAEGRTAGARRRIAGRKTIRVKAEPARV